MRVVVAVLGDLGRSPRMLYHARALADSIADVDLVGYVESEIEPAVATHPHIRVHALPAPRRRAAGALFLARAGLRALRDTAALLHLLLARLARPDAVLVQNPPAIPTLAVALAAARLRRARLVVDWHNFGWAMLALRLGHGHPAVRLARRWERALGRRADAHLCVSRAMAAELAAGWGIAGAVVLHDHPAERFAPTPPAARRALLARLADTLRPPEAPFALVVSPTSWTEDEDFPLLLDAARRLDARIGREAGACPHVLVAVTGRGPLRARYEREMHALALNRVHLRALWLEAADYPLFVGAADLGLSLHRSASGLDLPMKVADLLGAGVPVLALDFGPCLAEQVRDGENGLVFATADELAARLHTLLCTFPDGAAKLGHLRANVAAAGGTRWQAAWDAVARPVFLEGPRR